MKTRQIGVFVKNISVRFVGLQYDSKSIVCEEFKGGFLPVHVCMKTECIVSGSENTAFRKRLMLKILWKLQKQK